MSAFDLICPVNGDPLRWQGDALVSERGLSYPVVGGVPAVVAGVEVRPRAKPVAPAVIDQLLDAIQMGVERRPQVAEAFASEFHFRQRWLQVEADQFLHRVAASHAGLRDALGGAPAGAGDPVAVNVEPSIRLSSIFTLSNLPPATSFGINLRLINDGPSTLSSEGETPVLLSYHWVDGDGGWHEGRRTGLIDDLPPGREISQPIFIDTPDEAGRWTLIIRAVQEHVRWFDETSVSFEIEVGDAPSTAAEPDWRRTGIQRDYMGDHLEGRRLLDEWSRALFDRPVERVVEIGGNASPSISALDVPGRINIDIDPHGMIVGRLMAGGNASGITFMVADGMALPFAPRSLDMVIMSATFHHFPDPIGFLRGLRRYVRDDGLICLVCEPIGHVQRECLDPDFRAEIRKGVNEQSFALWEYQQMFDKAGLAVAAAQIDVGSAKFALRPRY